MKVKFFLSCILCMITLCTMAQLEVDSLGKVGINGQPSSTASARIISGQNQTALRLEGGYSTLSINNANETHSTRMGIGISMPVKQGKTNYGISISSNKQSVSTNNVYGVKSIAGFSSGLNIGIYGGINTTSDTIPSDGAGILGAESQFAVIPTIYKDRYAGFFNGKVRVTGELYATVLSPAQTTSTAPVIYSIDNTSKYREDSIQENVSEKLCHVQLLQFYRETETDEREHTPIELSDGSVDDDANGNMHEDEIDEDKIFCNLSNVGYGLAADQLREVFPELVYEDQNGNVSINYIEMIPLLVQANNELRARVAALESDKEMPESQTKSISAPTNDTTDDTLMLSLGQNNPNPFSEQTSIEVSVPESVSAAALLIFDMSGKQVKKIDINDRGIFRITVIGQGLNEGMYLYSLIADGKVVQTRKMILSK